MYFYIIESYNFILTKKISFLKINLNPNNMNNALLWILAVVLSVTAAFYTRSTGPTKPVEGKIEIGNELISYKLIRSYNQPQDAPVRILADNSEISGTFIYKRTPSRDDWKQAELVRDGEYLIAYIPQQPPAGKVMYQISLNIDDEVVKLTEKPITIRFRGDVPAWAMIPHILLMFGVMLLATRSGLAAIFKHKTFHLTLWTLIVLVLGGLVFGPIVQKYAFGAYWTGWPFGTDLTDNKTAFAALFWAFAMFRVYKDRFHRIWVITAAVVLMLVFMIPHSMMGSEIDFTQEQEVASVE
jgi:hypothetical protein